MTDPNNSEARDARIMAFIDGAMDEAEMAAFEAEMESDPSLADEVARMMANDDLLRSAFDGPIEEGVDDALLMRMGLGRVDAGAAPQTAPALPHVANDNPPVWKRWSLPLGGAIAASLVAIVTLMPGGNGNSAMQLADALEGLPSGETAVLADGSEVSPVLSFAAADGRYCREFSLAAEGASSSAIACRGDADWRVVATAGDGPAIADMGEISLASGASTTGLDEAYASLGASDPLDSAREADAMASGWQQD